jgi:anti-sigma regulatory factor (Ser/Thr protein kinase)
VADAPGAKGLPVRMSVSEELMLRLWPVPTSCAETRHAMRDFCERTDIAELADDAELLASEIVTNAIVHSATLITVLAVVRGGELVVTVSDDVHGRPAVRPADKDAETGRGMHVVAELAGAWGVTRRAFGKTVWFRLP